MRRGDGSRLEGKDRQFKSFCLKSRDLMITILCLLPFHAVSGFVRQSAEMPDQEILAIVAPSENLIPQTLLAIVHAPEIQNQLQLDERNQIELKAILKAIDRSWWPARNLPGEQLRELTSRLELELLNQFQEKFPPSATRRLQQLELQSQGPRLLLRGDVAQKLELTSGQQDQLLGIFQKTEKERAGVQQRREQDSSFSVETTLAELQQQEIETSYGVLTDRQRERLSNLLGPILNFDSVARIFPLAPDLHDSGEWFGTPLDPSRLAGKVVIVHFYAFQCVNCRRNFSDYLQWHQEFDNQEVVILGIQTPETEAERDPDRVREAALRDRFPFPVLVDLKKTNWEAWGNTMWPTIYVVDRNGYVRYWWQGELNWQGATGARKIAEVVTDLLQEK